MGMGMGLPEERQEALEESPPPPPPKENQEAPEERPDENDERIIFLAALKDLNQPTGEIDPPKGALSVPLFRHQKMALAWMVEKEKGEGVCVGGILADDQGLGKTISMTALIQMQRSLQKEHQSGKDGSTAKLEPLSLEDGEDENVVSAPAQLLQPKVESYGGKFASAIAKLLKPRVEYYGDKVASALSMLKPKVEYDGDMEEISKRRRLTLESSVVKPEAMEDDEGRKAKVQSVEVDKILRKIDCSYKRAAGTLVVCPASVLRQWARELDEKVTEESKLFVLVYHGSKRTSDPVELAYDVVLTT